MLSRKDRALFDSTNTDRFANNALCRTSKYISIIQRGIPLTGLIPPYV